uniref:YqzM family protein n=1 Tax=Globodera pallida TaxID=36090 RepID=A0A183BSQ8_GLOPA
MFEFGSESKHETVESFIGDLAAKQEHLRQGNAQTTSNDAHNGQEEGEQIVEKFFFLWVPGIVLALWHCFSDMFNRYKKESVGGYNKSAGIGRTMDGQKE